MKSKHGHWLADPDVRRWFENTSRGSPISADINLRRLGGFCELNDTTPKALASLTDRQMKNILLDSVSTMEARGLAGSYVTGIVKTIRSWLAFNGRDVKCAIKIRNANETPTLQDERVPTQDELRSIFLAGNDKTRTICALLAHSGLRPQALGNYKGTDGLTLKDLPELEFKRRKVTFSQVPTIVRVRSDLSKTSLEYFTFLGQEGCDYLRAYLEARLRKGEKLTPESAVITPAVAKKSFIRTINIGNGARSAIRRAGYSWRPYVLRSYFATQMMLAESKGFIIRDYRTFFMGHKGDIEAVYTLNKRKLPPDVVQQMRDGYAKASRYLETVAQERGEEELTKAFKKQLLLVAGFKSGDIKDEQLELEDEQFQKLVREKLVDEVGKSQPKQTVVGVSEVEKHLVEGWEFVGLLPGDKAILKHSRAG